MTVNTTIKKKKRVSKRNQAAWRKHCNINDVEEFLEDQRLEERLGKFEQKSDTELFILDTQGADAEEKPDIKPDITSISAKQRKRARLPETPKCFEVLLPTSKVQDPNTKRNYVKPTGSEPSDLSKLTEKRNLLRGVLGRKVEHTKNNKKLAALTKKNSKTVRQTFDKNIWDAPSLESKGTPETLRDEFISTEARLHNVLTSKRLRPRPDPPGTMVTRSAVEVPHPGVSYNPSFQEHRALLWEAAQHERKMMRRRAHLHRVTTSLFSRVTPAQKEKQWREEMSVGLPRPHDPAGDPAPGPAGDPAPGPPDRYGAVNPPVRNKKKDHKARRKQRERLQEKERLKRAKIDKQKITDLYKLRKIQSTLRSEESSQSVRRSARAVRRVSSRAVAAPALSSRRVAAREPDYVPREALSGDLRNLASDANLLRDRFESLQRRGALAASKIMMKKKRKLKSYFKPGHKVTDQEVMKYVKKTVGNK